MAQKISALEIDNIKVNAIYFLIEQNYLFYCIVIHVKELFANIYIYIRYSWPNDYITHCIFCRVIIIQILYQARVNGGITYDCE